MKKKIKKKPIIITAIVLILIGAGGYFMKSNMNKKPVLKVDYTELKKSELVNSINLKGVVKSQTATNIYSNLSYAIKTVPISVGDKVESGQLLLTLETEDVELNLKERRAQLSETSKANLNQLKNNERIYNEAINNLQSGNDSQVLSAKSKVVSTKNALDIAKKNYEDKLKENENKESIQLINAESTVESTKIDLDNKTEELEKNRILYEAGAVSQSDIETMEKNIVTIQTKYDDAVANVNSIKTSLDKEVTQLSDNLKTAQLNYDDALKSESSTLVSASQNIKKFESSVEGSRIAATDDAGAVAVQKLEKQLEDAQIKAPISGTITALYAKVGAPGNGLMAVIENTEKLKITTKFKEYDAPNVKNGIEVVIKSDATGDKTYKGEISRIAPTSIKNNLGESASTSDVEFEAEVTVTSPETDLKIGMNTRLNLILQTKENIFYVPFDAITKNENDEDIVYVVSGSAPTKENKEGYRALSKKVTMGMETDFYVEISSDELTEGMKIINDVTDITDGTEILID